MLLWTHTSAEITFHPEADKRLNWVWPCLLVIGREVTETWPRGWSGSEPRVGRSVMTSFIRCRDDGRNPWWPSCPGARALAWLGRLTSLQWINSMTRIMSAASTVTSNCVNIEKYTKTFLQVTVDSFLLCKGHSLRESDYKRHSTFNLFSIHRWPDTIFKVWTLALFH